MRRVVRVVVVLGLFAASLAPHTTASADEDVCSSSSLMILSTPLGPPLLSPPVTTWFTSDTQIGLCAVSGSYLHINGTITGWCGKATGSATANGHSFDFTVEGGVLLAVGEASGTAVLVPLTTTACTSPEWGFIVEWELAFTHVV